MSRPGNVEELVVLQRLVEVALAVEDRDAHVMPARQERFEVGRAPDRNRVEVGFAQHVNDVLALVVGQCDRDRGTCHGFGSLRVWEDSAQSSGSRALTVTTPSSPPVNPGLEPGEGRDHVAKRDLGVMLDQEQELTVRPGGDADMAHAGIAT